jgi:hypothetical protein
MILLIIVLMLFLLLLEDFVIHSVDLISILIFLRLILIISERDVD